MIRVRVIIIIKRLINTKMSQSMISKKNLKISLCLNSWIKKLPIQMDQRAVHMWWNLKGILHIVLLQIDQDMEAQLVSHKYKWTFSAIIWRIQYERRSRGIQLNILFAKMFNVFKYKIFLAAIDSIWFRKVYFILFGPFNSFFFGQVLEWCSHSFFFRFW